MNKSYHISMINIWPKIDIYGQSLPLLLYAPILIILRKNIVTTVHKECVWLREQSSAGYYEFLGSCKQLQEKQQIDVLVDLACWIPFWSRNIL